MPPIIVAFWIALGLSLGPPLAKGLITPKDPSSRPKWGKVEPVSYHTWLSSPTIDKQGTCHYTAFALATREELTRLRINGVEQLLDWSWSWPTSVPAGMLASGLMVEFISPLSGEVLATHELSASCPAAHSADTWYAQ